MQVKKAPGIVLYKQYDEPLLKYTGKFEKDAIIAWLDAKTAPSLPELDQCAPSHLSPGTCLEYACSHVRRSADLLRTCVGHVGTHACARVNLLACTCLENAGTHALVSTYPLARALNMQARSRACRPACLHVP